MRIAITTMVSALALLTLSACDKPERKPKPLMAAENAPALGIDNVVRVFYESDNSRSWGSLCKNGDNGYFSVHHVTSNGQPVNGGVQVKELSSSEPRDWSIVNIEDVNALRVEDYPELIEGVTGQLCGYPAADRDGECVPGRVYGTDTDEFMSWVEILPENNYRPEGVVGGFSGGCFLVDGKPAAVIHANGFSKIKNTTGVWALVIPIRHIIEDYRNGWAGYEPPVSLLSDPSMPKACRGQRWCLGE